MNETGIRAALERIVASDGFRRSERGSALLRYIVEQHLAGRDDNLNGTAIAQDVFGRDAGFDPASDPIVRVQASRLRTLLAAYYAAEGTGDHLRIDIPRGGYVPHIETRAAAIAPATASAPPATVPEIRPIGRPASRRPLVLAAAGLGLLLLALAGAAAVWWGRATPPPAAPVAAWDYPLVQVWPFENLTGNPANDIFRKGFQRQIAADLQRFRTVRVAMTDAPDLPADRGLATAGNFAVTGMILSIDDEIDLVVRLIDSRDAVVVTSTRLHMQVDNRNYFTMISELSARMSGRFAGPAGEMEQRELMRIRSAEGLPWPAKLDAFRCIVLFDDFTTRKSPATFREAHDCITRALATRPRDSALLAALSWMTALAAPESDQFVIHIPGAAFSLDEARRLAETAVAIDPGNDVAHAYLSLVDWASGREVEAMNSVQAAVNLNPGNPNHLADLARFSGLHGDWESALDIGRQAIARHGNPPGWYQLVFYFHAMVAGDAAEAVRTAALIADSGDPLGPVYRLAAAALRQDIAAVEALRPVVLDYAARRDGDVLRAVRIWVRAPEVVNAIATQLRAAGIPITDA